jgi:hypothetical protein
VSPIYTRPIREQLEHDRVIRQLQARYKRKHEVAINPGAEQNQSVAVGDMVLYPDLVLLSLERSRHLEAIVEVETGESVHLLEARAEWGNFARLPAPLFLYVPPQSVETTRRICDDQQIPVAEIWTYHTTFDQVRFTQVYKSPNPVKVVPPPPMKAAPAAKSKAAPAAPTPAKAAAKPPKAAIPAVAGKTANAVVKPAAKAAPPPPAKVTKSNNGAAKPGAKVAAKASAKPSPKPVARPGKAAPAKAVKAAPAKAVKAAKPAAKAKSASSSKKTVPAKKRR